MWDKVGFVLISHKCICAIASEQWCAFPSRFFCCFFFFVLVFWSNGWEWVVVTKKSCCTREIDKAPIWAIAVWGTINSRPVHAVRALCLVDGFPFHEYVYIFSDHYKEYKVQTSFYELPKTLNLSVGFLWDLIKPNVFYPSRIDLLLWISFHHSSRSLVSLSWRWLKPGQLMPMTRSFTGETTCHGTQKRCVLKKGDSMMNCCSLIAAFERFLLPRCFI